MKHPKTIDRRQFFVRTAACSGALLIPDGLHASRHDGKLKLLSYNIRYGFTEKSERKGDWFKFMGQQAPDIVSLQELNDYTPKLWPGMPESGATRTVSFSRKMVFLPGSPPVSRLLRSSA